MMDSTSSRRLGGVLISLPMSLLIVVMFFMPWTTLSCDSEAMDKMRCVPGFPSLPPEIRQANELTAASGWQLAAGEFTINESLTEADLSELEDKNVLRPRPWVYGCLVLPALLMIVASMGILGHVSVKGAGKMMILLGVGGAILMLVVSSVSYANDMVDQAREEFSKAGMAESASLEKVLNQARERFDESLKTEPTAYVWVSVGLYGLVAASGIAAVCAKQPGEVDWRPWREKTRVQRHFEHAEPQYCQPKGRNGLPTFGPDIPPFEPNEAQTLGRE